jgi:Ca2+/Na+ antiporter
MLNCANATFGLCAAVAPLDATAKNLFIVTNAAPGTGQQYTITFATNISSTILSCTISGAATSCSDKIHNANIAAGQQYTVKFTSSAGAAPVNITWGAELDTH